MADIDMTMRVRAAAAWAAGLLLATAYCAASAADPVAHTALLEPQSSPAAAADPPLMQAAPNATGETIMLPVADRPANEAAEVANQAADEANAEPPAPPDLWARIRNGFSMAEMDSEAVRRSEAFYASRPDYVRRIVERSKLYLFHIVEEVERRGMPTEIALLPIIESAYNPKAYSRSHASGIWQFIPSTAKTYGLQQNWWHDDRRDIVAATSAALDYLQNLYSMFGDWELALASYNWGEGAVSRSLTKSRDQGLPLDFRNMRMPLETQHYVPKLIAVKNIISDPAAFGIELESIPNQPYFEQVETTRHIDVKLAASLADISVEEFKALNPAYNRPVINVNGSRTLLLPADKVETFLANLENHDRPLVSWQAYQVKKGETADKISARYRISITRLKEVNGIMGRRTITPGQTLLVPLTDNDDGEGADISVMRDKPVDPPSAQPVHALVYTVRKGDTLSAVARRYGIDVAQVKSWNGGAARLVAGQKLVLSPTAPGKTRLAASSAPKRTQAKKRGVVVADARKRGRAR